MKIKKMVAEVKSENMEAGSETRFFGTTVTLKESNSPGIGAAQRWVKSELINMQWHLAED
jgi:hypothetical protein